jgi:hypothetical protein
LCESRVQLDLLVEFRALNATNILQYGGV